MNEYVSDAHPMTWYLFASTRLGNAAKSVLRDAAAGKVKIYLPAVAVAEMIMTVEKRRLPSATLPELILHLSWMKNQPYYELMPLDPDLVISSRTLTAIPDIFDRLIVAEALRLNLPLITRDSVIRSSGLVNVVWD
ncbi:MAG: type II toxin-antitoxin system VapC family toxin [Blastocatellia bacterium]